MEEERTKVQFLFPEYKRISFYFHRKKKNVLLLFLKNFPQLVKQSKYTHTQNMIVDMPILYKLNVFLMSFKV